MWISHDMKIDVKQDCKSKNTTKGSRGLLEFLAFHSHPPAFHSWAVILLYNCASLCLYLEFRTLGKAVPGTAQSSGQQPPP